MSMTEREAPRGPRSEPSTPTPTYRPRNDFDETKASFKTTEMWAMIVGVVALVIIYNSSSDLSLDLFRACLLATILATGYIVSRGIAKSGTRHEHDDTYDRS